MRSWLALLLSFIPALASAQGMDAGTSTGADGGPPDAGGCGAVTLEGECQDNVVVYCDVELDEIVTVDCEVDYGPTAICQQISPEYGVWCALATGEQCIYEDAGEFFTDFCQGTNAGCVETPEDGTCMENVGSCTASDARTCRGQRLIYDCVETQPWVVDCEAFLGTCEDDHCSVPASILCDDDVLVCEPGTTCGPLGLCEVVVQEDAGVPDGGATPPDAGTGSTGGGDEGCSCATSQQDRSSPYLLVLVAAWFIVRRRGR
jgi:MYXO-CTERM domain-containing protein